MYGMFNKYKLWAIFIYTSYYIQYVALEVHYKIKQQKSSVPGPTAP